MEWGHQLQLFTTTLQSQVKKRAYTSHQNLGQQFSRSI